jgi:hypothetical protein
MVCSDDKYRSSDKSNKIFSAVCMISLLLVSVSLILGYTVRNYTVFKILL